MKQDSISTSEFMEQQVVESSSVFTDFSTIAARGYNVISRARRNGRWWVLKSLEEKVRNTEPFVSMLRKEFDIMASLQDPNIVNVVSIEEVDRLGLSIVMEWIDGVTLGEWLKEPHSKKEKLRVLHQLITTLGYVHQHQTAHRDLKPSNVMVTHRGNNVKLIDFGLSDTDSFDYMKVPAGTVGYRAPEVEAVEAVEASATINYQRADIYSLGRIIEDFHLGRWSNPVVQRACASLDSRFQNVEEVGEKLLLAEKMFFWRWIAVVLFGICTIILGGGWVRQQFPEWSAPENAATKTLEHGRNLLGTGEKKKQEEKKRIIRSKARTFRNIALHLRHNLRILSSRLHILLRKILRILHHLLERLRKVLLPLRNLLQHKPQLLKLHRMQGWVGGMMLRELRWNVENASLMTMQRKCKP